MFVNSKNKFLTIRQKSQMTLIKTSFSGDHSELIIAIPKMRSDETFENAFEESEHEYETISVPVWPSEEYLDANTEKTDVEIWEKNTDAYAYTSPKYLELFESFFREPVRLVVKGPTPRICKGNADPKLLGRTADVNFPDILPVLVGSLSSLEELNARLRKNGDKDITIERFRPNIIIRGDVPWSEDEWKTVRINGDGSWLTTLSGGNMHAMDLDVVARCARCQVPNVHPDTAVKNKKQPWDTLMSYRRVDEGIKWKPCFGMLCCPRGDGEVKLGMRFEVLEVTHAHKYIPGF